MGEVTLAPLDLAEARRLAAAAAQTRKPTFYEIACGSGWAWPRDVPGFDRDAFPLEQPNLLADLLRQGAEIAETAIRRKRARQSHRPDGKSIDLEVDAIPSRG